MGAPSPIFWAPKSIHSKHSTKVSSEICSYWGCNLNDETLGVATKYQWDDGSCTDILGVFFGCLKLAHKAPKRHAG